MTESILDEVYRNTEKYQKENSKNMRKDKGQFFTSRLTALKMTDYLSCKNKEVMILEPGAGNGALTISVVLKLIAEGCKNINCVFVENDSKVLSLLEKNVRLLKEYSRKKNVKFSVEIKKENFLISKDLPEADIIIMNPPYKKIRKDSEEAVQMNDYVFGQPNLYSLFMVKALQLLKENGEFSFIVPRSWTSGEYYKTSRKYILENTDIKNICIFNARDKAFSSENVLQETMIFAGLKKQTQNEKINIDVYEDDRISSKLNYRLPSRILKNIGVNNYLMIPSNEKEIKTLGIFSKNNKTFLEMGYEFKTGPVVEFRNKKEISLNKNCNSVPMFRTANIVKGRFIFPAGINKAQYISSDAKKLLIKNNSTIFVRRLSAKEEGRRLQCCIYNSLDEFKTISIENHVNYLTKKDNTLLTQKELTDIYNLLMTEEYDSYFRLLSGSTQVNAKDLNSLPYLEGLAE